ncbi:MAG: Ig-like domain repeat protein [Myxococcales bacterium]
MTSKLRFGALGAALTVSVLAMSGAASAAVSTLYSEGFESGLNGWTSATSSGVCSWRVLNHPENVATSSALNPFCVTLPDTGAHLAAAGGTRVVWFGEESTGTFVGSNYPAQTSKNGGSSAATQTGTLTSPSISLSGVTKAQLEFDSWWEIEGVEGTNFDLMKTFISTDGGTSFAQLGMLNPTFATNAPSDSGYTAGGSSARPVWRHYSYDISAYVGGSVVLRFEFSSVDTNYNAFRGWTIDNVSIAGGTSLPGPTLTSVTPAIGTLDDVVSIAGTNFQQGAVFTIGTLEIPAANITQFGTNYLVFKVPSMSAGTYAVKVANPDGQSFTLANAFTYSNAASPSVTGVSPGTAEFNTAKSVSISGANFANGATVTVGGVSATGCAWVNAGSITCTFPGMVAGNYNVVVTNPSGQSGIAYSAYRVTDSSTVAVVTPNGGQSWTAGTVQTVTWTATGTPTVSLELWKNGVWVADIATNIAATPGSVAWTLPPSLAAGTDYKVKVLNPAGNQSDFSDANFTVVAFTGDIPPQMTTSSGSTAFLEDGAAVVVDGALELVDPDGPNLSGVRVSISSGFVSAEDLLTYTPSGGITGTYDNATGILTLSGSATAAAYQTVLRTVRYQNIQANNPTAGTRQISFSVGASSLYFADNGHYYEFLASSGISWTAARDAAALRRYYGLKGYLVTVTSAAENTFVAGKLAGEGWMGANDSAVEWTWRWVTGPEGLENSGAGRLFFNQTSNDSVGCSSGMRGNVVTFANWTSCEPNDYQPAGGEDYAHFVEDGTWNDYPLSLAGIAGYVVEYGGMPGDPTLQLSASKNVVVTACEANCSTCSSGMVCTACDSGYLLVGGDCISASTSTTTTVTSSSSTSAYGQSVTFTATLLPGTATGTVQFAVDGANLGTAVAVSGGTATSIATTSLSVGTHSVTATYAPTGSYLASSSSMTQTVTAASTTTALASSLNPSLFGQTVTFTATMTPAGATGTVQFRADGSNLGSPVALSGGVATYATSSLAVGTRAITAIYSGDGNYLTATGSLSGGQVVNKATPTMALASSLNPSLFGQTVTFTATMTPAGATGTVQFRADGSNLGGPVVLSGGVATYATSSLAVGTRAITAIYSGDANYFTATGTLSGGQGVNKAAPTMALVSSLNPSLFGQAVTFHATMNPADATGTVQFQADGSNLGSPVALSGGVATYATSSLAVGTRAITALYSGDASYLTATGSLSGGQVVNKATPTMALASSLNPSLFGQTVTFTATMTPAGATGTVQFRADGSNLGGPVALSGGVATYALSSLAVGTRAITALYSGDGNYLTATGTLPGGQGVNKAAPTVALVSSLNPSLFGQAVTFHATMTPADATGTVQFQADGSNLGSPVALSGGVATYALSSLAVGTRAITALYSGDASYLPATGSLSGGQVVNKATPTMALVSSLNPSLFGQSVTFTATMAPASATGTVQFQADGSNLGSPVALSGGVATYALSSLAVGTRAITAIYSGDGNYLTATGTLSGGQLVNKATPTVALVSSLNPSLFGQTVTFTATMTPTGATGTVQFQADGSNLGSPVALAGGVATYATSSLAVGTRTITAIYSGDASYLTATGTLSGGQVVNKAAPTMALASSLNPSLFGQTVTFTATMTPTGATGTVQFQADGSNLGSPVALSGGVATYSTSSLTVGTRTITAIYSGDGSYLTASGTLSGGQLVNKTTPTMALASSLNPSLFGQSVTFTATMTPAGATGTVQFQADGSNLGSPLALAGGVATYATSSLAVGTRIITAVYSGDASYEAATGTLSGGQLVNKAASAVALDSSQTPATYGTSVTFAVAVSPSTATGQVQFKLDGADLGAPVALVGGAATSLEVPLLAAGTHSVFAQYSGDGSYLASTGTLSQQIQKATTAAALALSPNPAVFGQPVDLTATVTSPSGQVPTGSVAFLADGAVLTSASLDASGVATAPVSTLPVGAASIVAAYSGDANHDDASSDAADQVVAKAATTVALASDLTPTLYGKTVTLTATVTATAPGAGTPTGQVTFFEGATELGTGALVDGVAVLEATNLAVGTHALHATFAGDGSFLSSTSDDLSQEIQKSCVVGEGIWAEAVANPENPCQVCDPDANGTDWTHRASGYACPADALSCTLDVCDGAGACTHPLAVGCLVSGACIAEGALDPENDCKACQPALDAARYTALAKRVSCADDLSPITDDYCDGVGRCTHPLKNECSIGGQVYAGGAANPTNSCQACDPLADNEGWTDRVMGFPCTGDALACTWDSCDGAGQCRHDLYAGCLIDGACVAAGTTDPANDCQECNPALATAAYSVKAKGVSCADDDQPNTSDVCDGAGGCAHPLKGQCTIAGTVYDAGSANPDAPCQACDPAVSVSTWTDRVQGFPCPADELACTEDVCDGAGTCEHLLFTGCLVDGACIGAGATDPQSECQACDPALSTAAYTAKARGVDCSDDGNANTIDVCDGAATCTHPLKGQCTIGGKVYDADTANPANPCQACEPAVSVTDWSNRVSGFPCTTDGLSCTRDVCDGGGTCLHSLFTGCLVDGACVGETSLDPANDCRACAPASSTTDYTSLVLGVPCSDDGEPTTADVCDGQAHCTHPVKGQCTIAGQVFDGGAANPENPCQSCEPTRSVSAWSDRVAGFPCTSDALSCTADTCDGAGACGHGLYTGCFIEGACVSAGSADPANECRDCNPALSTSGYSAKASGLACTDDGVANTLDVCDGAAACTHPLKGTCVIDGKAYDSGTANPQNPCQSCDSVTSATAWSNRAVQFPCASDGLTCTPDVCDGQGACTHAIASGCIIAEACVAEGAADPKDACFTCQGETSQTSYSLVSSDACAGACATDTACPSGTWCSAHVCRPQFPVDTDCTADAQCGSGHCLEGKCVALTMAGGCGCGQGGDALSLLGLVSLLGLALSRRRPAA